MPLSDPYSLEEQQISQRQKYAEMLREQAGQPLQTQMAGNRAIPISWTQGLAQGLKGYLGGKGIRDAETERKALAERMRGDTTAWAGKMPPGTPATPAQPAAVFGGGVPDQEAQAGQAAQPASPQQQMAWLGGAPNAQAAQMGGTMLGMQQKSQEMAQQRDFQRENLIMQLEAKSADVRFSAPERAEARRLADEAKAERAREAQDAAAERAREADAARGERQQEGFVQQRTMRDLINASRPAAAPSLTEIVDPADPTRMLRVDTRQYRPGGTIGSPGVFGVSGKEPTVAKRDEKEGQGKELLKSEIDNLRAHYQTLNESGAIPSDERGGMSNAKSWVQSSAAGQLGGRIFGTKEQTARNEIQSARLRILNAIKTATNMSAQQLNSNAELKTWLDSMTNLSGSYESNVGILDAIEKAFLAPKRRATDGAAGDPPPGSVRRIR